MEIKTGLVLLVLAFTLWAGGTRATAAVPPGFGEPPRILTGNLSVNYLRWALQGRKPPAPPLDYPAPEALAPLKRAGVRSIEDYVTFLAASPAPGKLDFSYYRRNAEVLKAAGMEYTVYPWLHFVPDWFALSKQFVPYKCLAHNEATFSTSVWAPQTLDLWRWFYAELHRQLGPYISAIYLGMPADYGEVGMPVGMTNWLVPERHFHRGFWCGDRYARRAFTLYLRKHYDSLDALNHAYDTNFQRFEDVDYPASPKAGTRRWLDFVDFYQLGELNFLEKATQIVRSTFGKQLPLQIKLGYGAEFVQFGVDNGRTCKLAAKLGIIVRSTHGKLPYYYAKRLATPAHWYGAPYLTEPPSKVSRKEEVWRLFCDASCGAKEYFDYPGNLLQAADLLKAYGYLLRGAWPDVHVALAFCTTDHWLHPEQSEPPHLLEIAGGLRPWCDYDVVDEWLIRDGALSAYSVLVWPSGTVVPLEVQQKLAQWVSHGGVLLKPEAPFATLAGDTTFWSQLQSVIPEKFDDPALQATLYTVGKGRLITLAPSPQIVARVLLALQQGKAPHFKFKPVLFSSSAQPVLLTQFPHALLCYNPTEARQTFDLASVREVLKAHKVSFDSKTFPQKVQIAPLSLLFVQLPSGRVFQGPSALQEAKAQ